MRLLENEVFPVESTKKLGSKIPVNRGTSDLSKNPIQTSFITHKLQVPLAVNYDWETVSSPFCWHFPKEILTYQPLLPWKLEEWLIFRQMFSLLASITHRSVSVNSILCLQLLLMELQVVQSSNFNSCLCLILLLHNCNQNSFFRNCFQKHIENKLEISFN